MTCGKPTAVTYRLECRCSSVVVVPQHSLHPPVEARQLEPRRRKQSCRWEGWAGGAEGGGVVRGAGVTEFGEAQTLSIPDASRCGPPRPRQPPQVPQEAPILCVFLKSDKHRFLGTGLARVLPTVCPLAAICAREKSSKGAPSESRRHPSFCIWRKRWARETGLGC